MRNSPLQPGRSAGSDSAEKLKMFQTSDSRGTKTRASVATLILGAVLAPITALVGISQWSAPAYAQAPIFQAGDAVVTGFAGVAPPSAAIPAGASPLDKFLI